MAKTATEQLNAPKQSKTVLMDKDFAGIKAGQTMFVATPKIVDTFIRAIPHGETSTVPQLREALAKEHGCDATCPVSTAIFVRIAAQAALDELHNDVGLADITPFWRVLTAEDKITAKLTVDPQWLTVQREQEQITAS